MASQVTPFLHIPLRNAFEVLSFWVRWLGSGWLSKEELCHGVPQGL